jgi:hypothetical protein
MKRNRTKHIKSFKARLLDEARRLIDEAEKLPTGPEREALLFKARHCEATAGLSDWLSPPDQPALP